MNRMLFESRYLINMAASIIRKDNGWTVYGKMDWERLFRIADYNRIANLIYLGVLGNEVVPENWRERFFERYQESLKFGEACEEGEQEILALLDFKEIPALVLESSRRRTLYEPEELAGECALRILIQPENYTLAKGFLIDLGYETELRDEWNGERMKRADRFSVEICSQIPYQSPVFQKHMRQLFETAQRIPGFSYIYRMDERAQLTYLLARISYAYVIGHLSVRQLLDLCLTDRKAAEADRTEIGQFLKKMKIENLSEKLLGLSYLWFGTKEECARFPIQDELEVYDVIETRILNYEKAREEIIPEALALAAAIARQEEREHRKARRKRFLQKIDALRKQLYDCFQEYLSPNG